MLWMSSERPKFARQMVTDELSLLIKENFGFTPTDEQDRAIATFVSFLTDRSPMATMIMRGSAGTGKTSVAGGIVRTMLKLGQKVELLAPTGRAAKVMAVNSDYRASTIHRRIYRQKTFGGSFGLAPNLTSDTLFIVDEASMIANSGFHETVFASGRLLDDLVSFVYSGRNCRLMVIGDKAQLPPVGEEESPALSDSFMEGYGLKVYSCDLVEVLRQAGGSGILTNATAIRRLAASPESVLLPVIRLKGFADIVVVNGEELIDSLSSSYHDVGIDETIVITRSNKRANIYNQGIRARVLDREETLTTGDMLMIVKNNYFWTAKDAAPGLVDDTKKEPAATAMPRQNGRKADENTAPSFLANGDRAMIQRVRNVRELYGFTFADLWLQFPDYDNYELQATAITDSLTTEAPALTPDQNRKLYEQVIEDYADIRQKPERIKKIKQDPYFNALQIKYAYAVTCHKAQGGQWAHVYLDQGYMTEDMLTPDYIHWLYTAFTRATERLYLVNWPKRQTE